MHIGLKYCGGCNCHYARIKEVEKLKKALPQHTFSYVAEHTVYDLVLLICVCMTACVETEGIGAKEFRFLRTPRDFTTVQQELATAITPTKREKKRLTLGDTASLTKTFPPTDITSFAALTGDTGKLHTDPEFAKHYGFGRPVVHGVFVASLLSSVMGTLLPGDSTILHDETVQFLVPVYAGDTITATITFTAYAPQKRWTIATLTGTCTNQAGITVVTGTFHQVLPHTLFIIEE